MQYSALLALAAATVVSAGGVTSIITPTGAAPAGCTGSLSGNFEITVVKPSAAKRDLEKRAACGGDGTLVIALENGILTDAKSRTGYIADNYQFQFDGPPQAGAIYTAGFSVCGNTSLALGPTTVFYQCLSGGFYNLYNKNWAPQCEPIAIDIVPCGGSSAPSSSAAPAASPAPSPVAQSPDGQPPAGPATPAPVAQYTDGQPQVMGSVVPTIAPVASNILPSIVSQITDGQPQAPQATPAPTPATTTPAAIATGAAVALGFNAQLAGVAGVAALALL